MIDIKKEKSLTLTAQDIHDIMDLSIQASEVNGFISQFDFGRALYTYSAIYLYEDLKESIINKIEETTYLEAWTMLLKDGVIEKMAEEYKADLEYLAESANIWCSDYCEYAHSIRGALNDFSAFNPEGIKESIAQITALQTNGELKNVVDIAEKWGMNNEHPEPPLFG